MYVNDGGMEVRNRRPRGQAYAANFDLRRGRAHARKEREGEKRRRGEEREKGGEGKRGKRERRERPSERGIETPAWWTPVSATAGAGIS